MRTKLLLALLLVTSVAAADPLDDYCTRLEKFGFSGAVLVARDGKILLCKGYGLAHREKKTPNTDRHLFEIASTTKPFTAAAILKLEERGRLSTDDPIAKYLPGVPEALRDITIYHLLTHTSGMSRTGPSGHGADLETAVAAYFAAGRKQKPGAAHEYWNGGYALLAGIVEVVTGGSYMDYCRTEILAPAGMTSSGFTGDTRLDEEPMAYGHSDDRVLRPANGHPYGTYGWQYRGMGGLVTSVADLYQFDRALYGDKVLKAATRAKYFEPHISNYACGWMVMPTKRKTRRISHGGDVAGFHTYFARFPDDDAVVIVCCNVDGVPMWSVGAGLESLLFAEKPRSSMPPATIALNDADLDAVVGEYALDGGNRLVVRRDGEGIRVGAVGQAAMNLLHARVRFDGEKSRYASEAELAAKLTTKVAAGDVELLRDVMLENIPPDWPDRVKRSIWPAHVTKWGEFKSARPIGASAAGRKGVFVLLALEHEKGSARCRIVFHEGKLSIFDLNGPPFAAEARCLPAARDRFVRFAWYGPIPPPLLFERGAKGAVVALSIKPIMGPAIRCARIKGGD